MACHLGGGGWLADGRVDEIGCKCGFLTRTECTVEGPGGHKSYPSYNATCIWAPLLKVAVGPRAAIGRRGGRGKVVMHSGGFPWLVRASILEL